jgi:hypothetical protein
MPAGISIDLTEIAALPDKLIAAIKDGARKAGDRHDWNQKLGDNIGDHFDQLSTGGRMEAIDGQIRWPKARHAATIKERALIGEPETPILNATGRMKRAFTKFGALTRQAAGDYVRYSYTTPSPLARMKARKHMMGGTHEAVFPHLSPGGKPGGAPLRMTIDFPQRQFLFFTKGEAADIAQDIGRSIDLSLQAL